MTCSSAPRTFGGSLAHIQSILSSSSFGCLPTFGRPLTPPPPCYVCLCPQPQGPNMRGSSSAESPGLDDFAHMGLINDLLE